LQAPPLGLTAHSALTSILNAHHAWAQNRADLDRGCTRTLDDNLVLRSMNRETLMEFRHDSDDETGHAGTGMKRAKNLFSSILTRLVSSMLTL
jgi:hypothetical protein